MSDPIILVVDDDHSAQRALIQVLRREKYAAEGASSGREALEKLKESSWDLIVTDIRMEGMDGMELMRTVRSQWPDIPVIVMTAFASIDTAIRSIHEGAYDYLSKPYEIDDLRLTVRRALEQSRLMRENLTLRQNLAEEQDREVGMIGMSPPMVDVYKLIARVARSSTTVLIQGESGSGKEVVARAIHTNSDRVKFPFIAVNCGALTESLLESELFGHVKGAFTGAAYTKQGLFEAANRGTVFLDEISETSPNMQTRLLRVLEEREIQRVGSMERIPVDIRVIAATNKELQQQVKEGKFREDLYYRLNVVTINVPSLRERMADLPLLFDHFLKRHSRRMGKTIAVHDDVMEMLAAYSWPGNVRELENVVERAVTLNTTGVLAPSDFAEELHRSQKSPALFPHELVSLEEIERQYILHVLDRLNGNMSRAAELLEIDRRTLYRMLERFGVKTG
ncbi:MAG TPA: sigma-54 dependent transcriptional regulator [Terriglobia bacterium]|nr:sigma-54 dependent transcriptional regulator [Terriglobia bacterium]